MSEQPQSIQPPDKPLDPHTLRVVLAELDRRPTTPSEKVVSDLLATANPRARVVVLPEACDDQLGSIYVRWPEWVGVSAMRLDQCQRFAHILLSAADLAADLAAEFAGGAKLRAAQDGGEVVVTGPDADRLIAKFKGGAR